MAKVNEKVKDKVNQKISEPRKYKILMYNDEVTTMDFVVHLLMHVFNKNKAVAHELMMTIHQKGSALVGVYSYDVAQTKMQLAKEMIAHSGFPLVIKCLIDK